MATGNVGKVSWKHEQSSHIVYHSAYVADHDLLGRLDNTAKSYIACRSGRDSNSALRTIVVGIEVICEETSITTGHRSAIETASSDETASANEATSRCKPSTTPAERAITSESVLRG